MKKKIFFTIFFFFIISGTISYAVPNNYNGKGSIIISKNMLEELFEYFIGPKSKQPEIFLISEDKSKFYKKSFRNYGQKSFINGSGNIKRHKLKCEIKFKQNCYLFANARVIVWDNGINPMKKKTSSIKYNSTKEDLVISLNELGFEISDVNNADEQNIIILDKNFGKN